MRFLSKTTTSLGIVLTELLTNTFKYAKGENPLLINISLKENNGHCFLTYSDSGTGLSEVETFEDMEQGTGLLLIREFISSLNGTLKLDTSSGTTFRIIFPAT